MRRPERTESVKHLLAPMVKGHGRFLVLILVLVLAAAGLAIHNRCAGLCGAGDVVVITIPADASRLMDEGREVPGIPDRIVANVGDTLLINNEDSSTQFVAGYPVSPHQVLEIPLNRAGTYETNCSVHRNRNIEMVISS